MINVYRVSFDFGTKEAAQTFFESITNLAPEDWHETALVEKDYLHDKGKHLKEFLVRNATPDNGRLVV